MHIEGNTAEAIVVPNLQVVFVLLTKKIANHDVGHVHAEYNRSVGIIMKRAKSRAVQEHGLEVLECCDLCGAEFKGNVLLHKHSKSICAFCKITNENMHYTDSAKERADI